MNYMEKQNFELNKQPRQSFFSFRSFGIFTAVFWALFLALSLSNVLSPYLSQIIGGLLSGITPILIGVAVAFIFARLIDFTENVVLKNAFKNSPYKFGIKRFISILFVMLIIISIFVLIFSILVPKIIEVIQQLANTGGSGLNEKVNELAGNISNLIENWFGTEVATDSIKEFLNSVFTSFSSTIDNLNSIMHLSVTALTAIFNFLMGLILAIFMLKDKEKITRFTKRYVYTHFKKERADEMCVITHNANKILFDYLICKVIEFCIIFLSLGIVYTIMGLKFNWELALIIGLFNFIPYFGIYIGVVPALIITLFLDSLNSALYMALATIIVTIIEGNFVIPPITGNKLKVSALVIASSVILGGAMFGMVGMLLAPPIAAIISVVIVGNIELKENKMQYVMEVSEQGMQTAVKTNPNFEPHPLDEGATSADNVENDASTAEKATSTTKKRTTTTKKSTTTTKKSSSTKTNSKK